MNDARVFEGGCLCGAVRWRAVGEPLWVAHCHCHMCRKNSGAEYVTGAGFRPSDLTWTAEKPVFYDSEFEGRKAKRAFCPRCGSWQSWHYMEEDVMITLGSFDHPEELRPQFHSMTEGQLPWVESYDSLPRHKQFAGKSSRG